jgi:hypothetical protein
MFGKPKFPVICDFDNTVIAFRSASDMAKKIVKHSFEDDKHYDIIDSKGEGFTLIAESDIMVAPSFFESKWTKRRLIDLVNNRSNKNDDSQYVLKNVDSKKLEVIIRELAELLNKADKKGPEMKEKNITITRKDMEDLHRKVEKNYVSFVDKLEENFASEQPEIYDCIESFDSLDGEEHDYFMDFLLMAWHIVATKLGKNKRVSAGFFNEQYQRNVEHNRDGIALIEGDPSKARALYYHRNDQPELMDFFIDLVFSHVDPDDDSEGEISGSAVAVILLGIKTVVDCLLLDEEEELAETCDSEYSDAVQDSMKKTVKQYYNEFRKSPYFMKLGHEEKIESEPIITCFGEMMYTYFLMHPLHWNARRATECAMEIMPAKVVSDDVFFESMESVLVAFMIFCAEKGYVRDGEKIAARLDGITEEILEETVDEEKWGIAKSIVEEAEREGVDITDTKAMEAFIKKYNKEQVSLFNHEEWKGSSAPGRNDPCPCGSGKKYKKCCGADQ